jgi:CDP-diacylglycerol---glycerol-3-phosphate 3-phosphatidyltransferase
LLSAKIGHSLDPVVLAVYRKTFSNRVISPNVFTVWGALFGMTSCFLVAFDRFILGGMLLLVSGFCDLLDGALARNTDRVTRFGGFLDSVLDRYTDLFLMCGVFVHFIRKESLFYALLTFIASIGIALIPYARARAEADSFACTTGLLERPERLILLLIGFFFGVLPFVILILAVFTHVTVIQRIMHVRRMADE